MRGGGQSGVVDDVFQAVGNAVQRAAPIAGADLSLGTLRILEGDVRREAQEGIEPAVVAFDAGDQCPGPFDR